MNDNMKQRHQSCKDAVDQIGMFFNISQQLGLGLEEEALKRLEREVKQRYSVDQLKDYAVQLKKQAIIRCHVDVSAISRAHAVDLAKKRADIRMILSAKEVSLSHLKADWEMRDWHEEKVIALPTYRNWQVSNDD